MNVCRDCGGIPLLLRVTRDPHGMSWLGTLERCRDAAEKLASVAGRRLCGDGFEPVWSAVYHRRFRVRISPLADSETIRIDSERRGDAIDKSGACRSEHCCLQRLKNVINNICDGDLHLQKAFFASERQAFMTLRQPKNESPSSPLDKAADALLAAHGHAERDGDAVFRRLIEAALLHAGRRLARQGPGPWSPEPPLG